MNQNSFLDKINTTIPVSMKTKNELKTLKGSMSYEEYLRFILRQANKQKNQEPTNTIETTTFTRKSINLPLGNYHLLCHYNRYEDTENFRFDIQLDIIRKKGKPISLQQYITEQDAFQDYFTCLERIIQKEIDSSFTFRKYGRESYKDYKAWKEHFKRLGLSNTSFEEDVMEKLHNLKREANPYD